MVGVDIDKESVFGKNGAKHRYLKKLKSKKLGEHIPRCDFYVDDLRKPDSFKNMEKKYGNRQFNIISCQFAIHYFFESEIALNNIKFKINENLNDITIEDDSEINKPKTFEEIQQEKRNYLNKFERYRKKGINLERNFNINSDINDMKNEFERITYSKRVENSVKMQRQCLLAFATGLEMLNSKYDPFDIKLDGWSESLNENINDYDEVFEDLYEKYKGKAEVAPELKLMMMVGGSAFMFHITNSMFKSSLPGMEQIIKQNPDIMKNFASAAMNTMSKDSPGLSNFIGEFGPQDLNNHYNNDDVEENFNRRDMKGPSDINDILGNIGNNNFNRNNSMSSNSENDISSIRNINFDNKPKSNGITLEL